MHVSNDVLPAILQSTARLEDLDMVQQSLDVENFPLDLRTALAFAGTTIQTLRIIVPVHSGDQQLPLRLLESCDALKHLTLQIDDYSTLAETILSLPNSTPPHSEFPNDSSMSRAASSTPNSWPKWTPFSALRTLWFPQDDVHRLWDRFNCCRTRQSGQSHCR